MRIYIYIYREREIYICIYVEREREILELYICIYIYIYMFEMPEAGGAEPAAQWLRVGVVGPGVVKSKAGGGGP